MSSGPFEVSQRVFILHDQTYNIKQSMSMIVNSIVSILAVVVAYICMSFGFSLVPTPLARPELESAFIPNPGINLTQLLLEPALPFHVVYGHNEIGKSTAMLLAAAEVSAVRSVLFLSEPPADYEFYKLFYHTPSWLKVFGLLDLFSSVRSITIADFRNNIDRQNLPILVIDNIEHAGSRLPQLMRAVTKYAQFQDMRIVLICTSGSASELRFMSPGEFISFPPLPNSLVDQILRFRGFSAEQARQLAVQVGHSLTTIHTVPLKNPETFIENAVQVLQGFYLHCCEKHFEVDRDPRVLIGAAYCSMFHQCLLSKNLFIHDRLGFLLDYQSELVQYALELLPVREFDDFQRHYEYQEN